MSSGSAGPLQESSDPSLTHRSKLSGAYTIATASTKSIWNDFRQIERAVARIQLGTYLQVLESATGLSYERLLRLYNEVASRSQFKGNLTIHIGLNPRYFRAGGQFGIFLDSTSAPPPLTLRLFQQAHHLKKGILFAGFKRSIQGVQNASVVIGLA